MKFEVGKIGAAVDQLDWAIKLFLDYKAYVPAITLPVPRWSDPSAILEKGFTTHEGFQ